MILACRLHFEVGITEKSPPATVFFEHKHEWKTLALKERTLSDNGKILNAFAKSLSADGGFLNAKGSCHVAIENFPLRPCQNTIYLHKCNAHENYLSTNRPWNWPFVNVIVSFVWALYNLVLKLNFTMVFL